MPTRRATLGGLARPYGKLLGIAFVATLVESAANLMEPWPLKVVFDYVIGSKRPQPGSERHLLACLMASTGSPS